MKKTPRVSSIPIILLKTKIGLTAAIIADTFADVVLPYFKPILYEMNIVTLPIIILKTLKGVIDLVRRIHNKVD